MGENYHLTRNKTWKEFYYETKKYLKINFNGSGYDWCRQYSFYAAAETSLDARAGQAETVPTSYQVPNSLPPALPESGEKDTGAQTVNYHISMDDLNTETPTDVDLTMEEAAKTGAQYLKNIYGLDLEGAYVYMMYNPGTVTFPRAFWSGDVLFEKKQTPESTRWTFMVDAVTGELFNAGHGRQLDANPPLGLDQALEKDCSQYKELARKKTEEWNAIAEKCSLMIAPCQEIADAMTLNGLPQEKLRTVPHGIPLPEHRPSYPSVDGKIRMFYVGRICYVKGIHTLLEAMSMVEDSRLELHLIGGAGNSRECRYMRHLQKKHKNDARIVWHGKIQPNEVYEAIYNMHFSSSSAFLEAFGLNIAESMAMGKPVLATRSGGAEQQITDGVNGWLVPTNDPTAMAAQNQRKSFPSRRNLSQCPPTVRQCR